MMEIYRCRSIRHWKKRFMALGIRVSYQNLYLETHTNLEVARKLYERLGFAEIERPASVCHGTMDHFYLKKL